MTVNAELCRIVAELDAVIARCNRLGLPAVSERLAPIRDMILLGVQRRTLFGAGRRLPVEAGKDQ